MMPNFSSLLFLLFCAVNGQISKKPFSEKLLTEVIRRNAGENVIISPISIYVSVATAIMGPEVEMEIASILHSENSTKYEATEHLDELLKWFEVEGLSEGVEIDVANRIYLDKKYEIVPSFNELNFEYFGTKAENVDFGEAAAAAKQINAWMSEKTNGTIKDIIRDEQINASTKALVVNAMKFQGFWKKDFNLNDTIKGDFHLNKQTKIEADMMNIEEDFEFANWEDFDATALKIPFANTDIFMMIILPKQIEGLEDLKRKLQGNLTLDRGFKRTYILLSLPRFKVDFDIVLKDVLEELGLGKMFSEDADFSDLTSTQEPFAISNVHHKGLIDVNEFGVGKSNVSDIDIVDLQFDYVDRQILQEFKVDHPFLFAIMTRDNIYYAGQVKHL